MIDKASEKNKNGERLNSLIRGLRQGHAFQTRFTTIPKRGLSRETAGGIWDLAIAKKGKAIIRFDRGRTTSPHINIDPKAISSRKNPHIPVNENVVTGVGKLNKYLKYLGPTLTLISVAADAYRLGSSAWEDWGEYAKADEILKELNEILEFLYNIRNELENGGLNWLEEEDENENENEDEEEDEINSNNDDEQAEEKANTKIITNIIKEEPSEPNLEEKHDENNNEGKEDENGRKKEIDNQQNGNEQEENKYENIDLTFADCFEFNVELVEHYEKRKKDIELLKSTKVPCGTIKTASSMVGGYGGGAVAATGGMWAGAQTGAITGSIFGPTGATIGGVFGAVAGALGAGIGGGIIGSVSGEAAANYTLGAVHNMVLGNSVDKAKTNHRKEEEGDCSGNALLEVRESG